MSRISVFTVTGRGALAELFIFTLTGYFLILIYLIGGFDFGV